MLGSCIGLIYTGHWWHWSWDLSSHACAAELTWKIAVKLSGSFCTDFPACYKWGISNPSRVFSQPFVNWFRFNGDLVLPSGAGMLDHFFLWLLSWISHQSVRQKAFWGLSLFSSWARLLNCNAQGLCSGDYMCVCISCSVVSDSATPMDRM